MNKTDLPQTKVTLFVTDEVEGLLSIDPYTSYFLLQARMQKRFKANISVTRFNFISEIPRLVVNDKTYTHSAAIQSQIQTLAKKGVDKTFTSVTQSRIAANKSACEKSVCPAVTLLMWGDAENAALSAKYYSQGFYQPFKFFYVRRLRNQMKHLVDYYCGNESITIARTQAYEEFARQMEAISCYLNTKPYIFGHSPSTFDMYICSYLAPIVYIHYPNNDLKSIVQAYPNILNYLKHFMDNHGTGKVLRAEKEIVLDTLERASTLTLICASVFTASAMFGFAIMHGIIKIRFVE